MVQLWLFMPLFAFLDRLAGGRPQWPGKGTYYAPPLLILASLLAGQSWFFGLVMALAFIAWRSPAWRTFGGDLAPKPDRYLGTLARHAIAVPAFGLAIMAANFSFEWSNNLLWLLGFPPMALGLAIWTHFMADRWHEDVTNIVEPVRGALLWLCVLLALGVLDWPVAR